MSLAVNDDVVELHVVRTFQVVRGLFGLFQPVHAHGGARKIAVTVSLDDVVAVGDNAVVHCCFHDKPSDKTLVNAQDAVDQHYIDIGVKGRRCNAPPACTRAGRQSWRSIADSSNFARRRPADEFPGVSVTFMLLPCRQHALLCDGVDPPVAAPPPPLACAHDAPRCGAESTVAVSAICMPMRA